MTAERSQARAIAVAGLVAFAVAMGIGRFAFTPILPMMLADGTIDLHGASWLATANYAGYLLGALFCTSAPRLRERWRAVPAIGSPQTIKGGLVATGVLTIAMAVPIAPAWPAWRFASGIASAFVFISCSGWCLARLAERGAPSLGGLMFAGPGAGIVASGLVASALVATHAHAAAAWALFGVAALALTAFVWPTFADRAPASERSTAAVGVDGAPTTSALPSGAAPAPALPGGTAPAATVPSGAVPAATVPSGAVPAPAIVDEPSSGPRHGRLEVASLVVGYGLSGFGYIVTATFLPVIARTAIPGSRWLDLFWPVFGSGVVVGALLATRLRQTTDLRRWLAGAYAVQAIGIGIGVAWPSAFGFASGSFLLGVPFTAITFFAVQEARRLHPASSASLVGLMTVCWALGQSAGPPVASWLLAGSSNAAEGFTRSLVVAASALLAGATVFAGMSRRWPLRRDPRAELC